jgi:hypothetical protein
MKKFILLTLSLVQAGLIPSAMAVNAAGFKTSVDLINGGSEKIDVGNNEMCILPRDFALDGKMSLPKDDKKQKKLCHMSFYETSIPEQETFLTCPKLNSTNPGVLVVELPTQADATGIESPKYSIEVAEDKFCKPKSAIDAVDKQDYKVKAKFKQSITCSYAPSALAAYHVSRFLGGVLDTPVAVVRTMDHKTHRKVIDKAREILKNNPNDMISKSWAQFDKNSQESLNPKLYIDEVNAEGGKYLYGALSENVTQEYIYTEVSGVGPYETRYERFMKQTPFQRVADTRSVQEIINESNAQPEVVQQQMKDVSDMIVLDTLLSQDDRIGNIHFHLYWTQLDTAGKKITKTQLEKKELLTVEKFFYPKPLSRVSESDLATKIQDPLSQGRVLTRVMTLKDNDCGVDVDKRSNNMRMISAIEQVRHMSQKTYDQILKMKDLADKKDPAFLTFFRDTLLYRASDFSTSTSTSTSTSKPKPKPSFVDNLDRVVTVITKNFNNGNGILKIDLIDESKDAESFKSKAVQPAGI